MFTAGHAILAAQLMKLPLLEFTAGLYPHGDFSDTAVIACQHILGTTDSLFEEFFKRGLKPDRTFLLGKCYSSHSGTLEKFKRLGVQVSGMSIAFDPLRTFDDQFSEYVKEFVRQALSVIYAQGISRVLILDDGGYLIERINQEYFTEIKFVAVEQTSSGYEKLKKLKLTFPVVNVARSEAKLELESPFIAAGIIKNLLKRGALVKSSRVLVIGQGPVGQSIKRQLAKRYRVNGCDIQADKCDFGGDYKEQLGNFDVIIGASGQSVLDTQDLNRLRPGAALVSASSSDREFPALAFRKVMSSEDCHIDVQAFGFKLLNQGFPVNFDGSKYSQLPPKYAQLTRSLLFMAACEALSLSSGTGLFELSEKQKFIVNKFKEYQR